MSQNLSHKHIGTTFKYNGNLEDETKCAIISTIRERHKNPINEQIAERFDNTAPELKAAVLAILKIGEKD